MRSTGDRGGKDSLSEAQKLKQKKTLTALMKHPDNRQCADCDGNSPPTWASVNLGVFVCLTCSGIHRSLGVHISKVRSATLDTWLPEQVQVLTEIGNRRANLYFEKEKPPGMKKPDPNDTQLLERYIRQKYDHKQFADRNRSGPVTASEEKAESERANGSSSSLSSSCSAPSAPAPAAAAGVAPKPPAPKPAAPPAPAAKAASPAAAAPPLVDLLGLDISPAPPPVHPVASAPSIPTLVSPSTAAVAAAAPPTDWAVFTDPAPPVPQPPSTSSSTTTTFSSAPQAAASTMPPHPASCPDFADFADFQSSAATTTATTATPTTTSTAQAPEDEFAALFGEVSIENNSKPAVESKPEVNKTDILNLYSQPGNGAAMSMGGPMGGFIQQPYPMQGNGYHMQHQRAPGMMPAPQMNGYQNGQMGYQNGFQNGGMPQMGYGMMPQPQMGMMPQSHMGMMPPQMGAMPNGIPQNGFMQPR